jgi:hypothetical protein
LRSKLLTADIRCYVRPEEKRLLEDRSRECGLSLSQWTRQRLFEAAQRTLKRASEKTEACQ